MLSALHPVDKAHQDHCFAYFNTHFSSSFSIIIDQLTERMTTFGYLTELKPRDT